MVKKTVKPKQSRQTLSAIKPPTPRLAVGKATVNVQLIDANVVHFHALEDALRRWSWLVSCAVKSSQWPQDSWTFLSYTNTFSSARPWAMTSARCSYAPPTRPAPAHRPRRRRSTLSKRKADLKDNLSRPGPDDGGAIKSDG
ncbi:hypothetical protein EVAR_45401_1 [Eumeta japonica]|uniref:Uncharacterized protein n=1 Tax=Eumeta variegata TaxID=151549 RepID=A0A4C1WQ59_EUMVA|nr:hypothetical protein EVAR_45401_1 [Eumeta japonica]